MKGREIIELGYTVTGTPKETLRRLQGVSRSGRERV